jgi:hypothetical protein
MRKWSHLHSLAAGGLGASLLLQGHLLWTLTIVFALGVACGWFGRSLRAGGHHAASLLAEKLRTERARGGMLRASRLVKLSGVRAKRVELEKAYQRGYIEGKLDAGFYRIDRHA